MRAVTSLAIVAGLASSMVAAATIDEFNLDPSTVELEKRGSWCLGERNTCTTLCDDNPKENRCDINTLDYTCTCRNGTEPGLRYYSSSLYSFVCQEAFAKCSELNAGNPVELPKCDDEIRSQCGTLDVTDYEPVNDDGGDEGDDGSEDADGGEDGGDGGEDGAGEGEGEGEGGESGSPRSSFVSTGAAVVAIGLLAAFL